MKRSFRFLLPVFVVISIILSAFILAPGHVKMAEPAKDAFAVVTPSPTLWPNMPTPQQTPLSYTFRVVYECPPEGRSPVGKPTDNEADRYQNKLKNRVDEGAYKPVKFQDILDLYPTKNDYGSNSTDKVSESRSQWTVDQKAQISRYEGFAVSVEGYVFGAEKSGDEKTNCNYSGDEMKDWHITITGKNNETNRENAIVVETTPRIREYHPGWTLEKLSVIAKKQYHVRISGWLFFDPEHSENLPVKPNDTSGVTRGTLWEVHPVMKIEVDVSKDGNGPWYLLDSCEIKGTKINPTLTSTPTSTPTSKCEL